MDGGPDIFISLDAPRHILDMDDPVLLDGGMGQTEDLNVFSFSGNGAFACFSDQMFRNGIAHLRMNAFSSWNDEGPDFKLLSDLLVQQLGYDEIESRGLERCRAEHRLEVRLSHCSQEAYYYLRSLRTISSNGYYPEIVEPVTIPSHCSQEAYYYLRSLRTISSNGYYPEIVEPVTIPTNIVGGVGFVDVVNTTVARIELPTEERRGITDIFDLEEPI